MKMLFKDRATHVLWIIFAIMFDSDIHLHFRSAEMLISVQIRSYLYYQHCEGAHHVQFCLRILKVPLFYRTTIRRSQKSVQKGTSTVLPLSVIAHPKIRILLWNFVCVLLAYSFILFIPSYKIKILKLKDIY